MLNDADARIARDDLDHGPFAGLEELRKSGATCFDRFARIELTEPSRAPIAGRFDVCIELGPPPRLA